MLIIAALLCMQSDYFYIDFKRSRHCYYVAKHRQEEKQKGAEKKEYISNCSIFVDSILRLGLCFIVSIIGVNYGCILVHRRR